MLELAYSFHIGNDKNKTKKAKAKRILLLNYNNNAIQKCYAVIKNVNHHNLRQYDNNPEKDKKTLYGSK